MPATIISNKDLQVVYEPSWEICKSGIYFVGYNLPVQEGMFHRSPLHFDTTSDLHDYVWDKYGEVRSIESADDGSDE